MAEGFRSFEEFWPHYLAEHAQPLTRAVHVGATWAAAVLLLTGLILGPWWLILCAPVLGYGGAWLSHLLIERNRPTTFRYPLWSLRADIRMAGLAALGRLGSELRRHGRA